MTYLRQLQMKQPRHLRWSPSFRHHRRLKLQSLLQHLLRSWLQRNVSELSRDGGVRELTRRRASTSTTCEGRASCRSAGSNTTKAKDRGCNASRVGGCADRRPGDRRDRPTRSSRRGNRGFRPVRCAGSASSTSRSVDRSHASSRGEGGPRRRYESGKRRGCDG